MLHACSARCTDQPLHPCINIEPVVQNSSSCSPCTVVWHNRRTPTLPHKYSTVSRNTETSLDPWALLKSLCTCQTPSAVLPGFPSPSKAKCLCASGDKRDGALGGHQRPLHTRSTGSIKYTLARPQLLGRHERQAHVLKHFAGMGHSRALVERIRCLCSGLPAVSGSAQGRQLPLCTAKLP